MMTLSQQELFLYSTLSEMAYDQTIGLNETYSFGADTYTVTQGASEKPTGLCVI